MVDILLAHAFYITNDTKQREEKFRPYPPLATLYAASILRDSGYEVALYDATLEQNEDSFQEIFNDVNPRLLIIYEDNFNFLSKMCLTHVREATLRMAKTGKDAGTSVIVCSSDASDDPSTYLACGVDYVILGEGDVTVKELSDNLLQQSSMDIGTIPGIAYINGDRDISQSPRRMNLRDLDSIPFPARDLVDIENYRDAWESVHGYFSMSMVTTRGCPYACTWCAKPIWGKSYAVRSPENVAEEQALLKQHCSPDHIWFMDDIFGLKPGWIERYSLEVNAREANIPFMIQTRADLMNPEVVKSLADANCEEVWLGAESGSQSVLDSMKKGITVEQIHEARRLLGDEGIRTCFFIQFGYPGETLEDISLTVDLVRSALPDNIGVSVSYPLPGTEFHELVMNEINEKTHWNESNDLEIMFEGAYDSSYYRKLGKFLHRDLDARLGISNEDLNVLQCEWEQLVDSARNYEATASETSNTV